MFTSREAIYSALWTLLQTAIPPAEVGGSWQLTDRNLKLWSDVPPANQPALFMVQNAQDGTMSPDEFLLSQWKLKATAWIYYQTDSIDDPNLAKDTVVNKVIDAIEAVLNPMPGIAQTLGGLVLHTYIDGAVISDNGLTDPQAIILIPITILIGAFLA